MNAVLEEGESAAPFDLPRDVTTHFQLSILGVIAHLIEEYADGDLQAAFTAHAFLQEYCAEILTLLGMERASASRWRDELRAWEQTAPRTLPICALRDAGLDELEIELLLAAGLVDEDPRFGALFDQIGGQQRRPTFATLLAWWRTSPDGADRLDEVRQALLNLLRIGLLKVVDETVPRTHWALSVPAPIWDGLRAQAPDLQWLKYAASDQLLPLHDYLPASGSAEKCAALPAMLRTDPRQLIVFRGPHRNGRKTLAGGIAHALGKGVLVATEHAVQDEARWRQFLIVALTLNAIPVVELESAPGSNRVLPAVPLGSSPIFVVTGMTGAIGIADDRPALSIELPIPDVRRRTAHWQSALGRAPDAALATVLPGMRLTSGNIRRATQTASNLARLAGRLAFDAQDLRLACRTLQADRLETLATRLDTRGGLDDLAVDEATRDELNALVARCRHREALADRGPTFASGGVGVRALFAGASGTGKTLATRLLASTLGKDIYRVDLAATVNKYLGETEKNLDRAFAAAEELDAILLLDEGDALMASRTDVSSSNDRYANLETNFLLQRIESFTGIALVTSNAADRIDKAFARRMDVVIHFRPPDEWTRHEILRMHLPGAEVSDVFLQDIACRCMLSGGQLRNVASHATLLALQRGAEINDFDLHAALAREYRKTGSRCPLPPPRFSGA